jgi:hypothetical protein
VAMRSARIWAFTPRTVRFSTARNTATRPCSLAARGVDGSVENCVVTARREGATSLVGVERGRVRTPELAPPTGSRTARDW